MKQFLSKALFFYSAAVSFLISVSLVATSSTLPPVVFAIFFLPVTAYFVIEFSHYIKGRADVSVRFGKGGMVALAVIFFLLIAFSLKNIYIDTRKTNGQPYPPMPSSSPLIFKKGGNK